MVMPEAHNEATDNSSFCRRLTSKKNRVLFLLAALATGTALLVSLNTASELNPGDPRTPWSTGSYRHPEHLHLSPWSSVKMIDMTSSLGMSEASFDALFAYANNHPTALEDLKIYAIQETTRQARASWIIDRLLPDDLETVQGYQSFLGEAATGESFAPMLCSLLLEPSSETIALEATSCGDIFSEYQVPAEDRERDHSFVTDLIGFDPSAVVEPQTQKAYQEVRLALESLFPAGAETTRLYRYIHRSPGLDRSFVLLQNQESSTVALIRYRVETQGEALSAVFQAQ